MKKYAFLILFLFLIKFFNLSIFTKEINISNMISGFASNLYIYDETVATKDIMVFDYEIKEKSVHIVPIKNEVILPISGIINKVGKDYIEIQSTTQTYQIYGISSKYHLYQYYKKGMVLGESEEYVVCSDSIDSIVSCLVLSYESI